MLPTPSSSRCLFVAAIAMLLGTASLAAAVCDVNYAGASNGQWQTPGNWDTNAVPTSAQVACIPSGKGTIVVANGVSAAAKDITAASGLQIDAGGSLTIADATVGFGNTVTDVSIAAGATFATGGSSVAVAGLAVVDGMFSASVRLDSGTLRGTGTIVHPFQNVGGTVQPGGPGAVGTLEFGSAFNQSPGGTLELDLASDSSFDKIHGPFFNHFVDGTIVVNLLGGYTPAVDTTWDFIPPDGPGTSIPAHVVPSSFTAHPISMGAQLVLSSPLGNTTTTVAGGTTTTTTLTTCGNAALDAGEECDQSAFGGVTCPGVADQSCRRCTTDCTVDCTVCGATAVDSFILPSALLVKLNTKTPAKSKLVAAGIFDSGPQAVDLAASAMLQVGGIDVAAAAPAAEAGGFVLRGTGFLFKVVPAKTGSSKAKFTLKLVRDLMGQVNPDAPLTMRFTNPGVDGIGTVRLSHGRYRLRRRPGDLVAPTLYLVKTRAHLLGGGKDTLSLQLGLATDGQIPPTPPDVTVAFGPTYTVALPSSAFVEKGSGYAGTAGGVQVTLDYRRELVTVRAKKADLGTFANGPQPVLVAVSLGTDARINDVRMVRKGKALRY